MEFNLSYIDEKSIKQFNNNFLKVNSQCQKCAVNSLCLPAGLSSAELIELETVISSSKITDKNKCLFNCGENFNALYVVHSGMFKSAILDENGKEKIINFHLPGEFMGLDGIHSDTYQSTATALTMSSFCKIPYEGLLEVTEDCPVIQKNLMKLMSKELCSCKKNHLDLGSKAKLALFIKTMSERFKLRGYSEDEFFLPISQRDIANYLGMAEETLSRVFKKLQRLEAISYKKHIMMILNQKLLTEISAS